LGRNIANSVATDCETQMMQLHFLAAKRYKKFWIFLINPKLLNEVCRMAIKGTPRHDIKKLSSISLLPFRIIGPDGGLIINVKIHFRSHNKKTSGPLGATS